MNEKIKAILNMFEEINKVPRQSKHEEKISQWLVDWAEKNGFKAKRDKVLNVLIEVPATPGHEDKPVIVFQGHMDMVCEKTPESTHDFSKDPIKHVFHGDWLKGDGTTLGADNGIALAIAMVIATDETVVHPPLELLFTVDEETGLTGANALEPGFLKGKVLLNLDTEDEGVFTIGCAGGRDTKINFTPEWKTVCEKNIPVEIRVGGLEGGHSGGEIHLPKGNANIILARVLDSVREKAGCLKIGNIDGGSAHNAIPRDAYAVICMKEDQIQTAEDSFNKIAAEIKDEFKVPEPKLSITFKKGASYNGQYMTGSDSKKFINLMMALPNGVAAMSTEMEGLVETSNNFATIRKNGETVTILTSQRSSIKSRLDWITAKVEKPGILAGAEVKSGNGYPNWQPKMDSTLTAKCVSVYEKLYGKKPVLEIIHAGLECGIIGSKYEGMEMISYGPTIRSPHCPDERMFVPSLENIWDFTAELLKSYCE